MSPGAAVAVVIVAVCLGLSIVAAVVGVFMFQGFKWWDKF
jgi:hypothetical protein